jgi:putative membrane protein
MTGAASPRWHAAMLAVLVAVSAWSLVEPRDRFTWVLEAAPAYIAAAAIAVAYGRWRLTPLALTLVTLHALILLVGAKYTYAEVPPFNWLRDEYGLARNYYDRVGHFAQGFVPAIVAREVLLRNRVVPRGAWLFVFVTSVCLAVSAAYELVEWAAAMISGEAAEAFLGTQGDHWDTQWDMFVALCGALVAQAALARWHDAQLARVNS